MAMPTRILIKVNLILIQYRARKEREWALGIGHWTWGIGHWAWGMGDKGMGRWGERRITFSLIWPPPHLPTSPSLHLPHLPHPPHPPCPMPYLTSVICRV